LDTLGHSWTLLDTLGHSWTLLDSHGHSLKNLLLPRRQIVDDTKKIHNQKMNVSFQIYICIKILEAVKCF